MNSLYFICARYLILQSQSIKDGVSGNWEIFTNPVILSLVIVSVVLLMAVAILGSAMIKIKYIILENHKKKAKDEAIPSVKTFLPLAVVNMAWTDMGSFWGFLSENIVTGVDNSVFYFLLGTILVELIVLLFIIRTISNDVRPYLLTEKKPAVVKKKFKVYDWWWNNLNKAVNDEEKVDTGHVYDGIRELDNQIPPWWRYAFYSTMVFAVVYFWRYHVSQSAPLQMEEYEIAVARAEEAHKAYLLAAGNQIDENNVELTDAAGIQSGEKIFKQNCAACHGGSGEGLVGPNLTDEYWIHGEGRLSDVFSVVKYGVIEKGMMAWKDQLSPSMIAQVSSYVMMLQGTDPPNPKEPQGDRYKPEN